MFRFLLAALVALAMAGAAECKPRASSGASKPRASKPRPRSSGKPRKPRAVPTAPAPVNPAIVP
jgi:hypothetical protein